MIQGLVSKHGVEHLLGQIAKLQAQYPNPGQVVIDDRNLAALAALRLSCAIDDGDWRKGFLPAHASEVHIRLNLGAEDQNGAPRTFQLSIFVSFEYEYVDFSDEPRNPSVDLVRPSWMTIDTAHQIIFGAPVEDAVESNDYEFLFTQIDYYKARMAEYLSPLGLPLEPQDFKWYWNAPLVRVWFSISSILDMSQREDIVTGVRCSHLTGFFVAGEPGVLCVEGPSGSVDYFIKFMSIQYPFFSHLNVTERLRTDIGRRITFVRVEDLTEKVDNATASLARGDEDGPVADRLKVLQMYAESRRIGDEFLGACSGLTMALAIDLS